MPSASPSSLPPDASSLEILLMWLCDLPYPVVTEQPDTPPAASAGRGTPKSHQQNAAAIYSSSDPARRQLSCRLRALSAPAVQSVASPGLANIPENMLHCKGVLQ